MLQFCLLHSLHRMQTDLEQFEKRKQDHLELAMHSSHQASECNDFETLYLIHEALPDLDFEQIDITTQRLGKRVRAPFIVSSMTAGHQHAPRINARLLQACTHQGWAMGVGSQRRELFDASAWAEWANLRREWDKVQLFGNLGIAQLIQAEPDQVKKIIENLHADALIIHCNPLQELIQPEGTPQFKGCWKALEALVKYSPVPIVIKETGCGFSTSTLARLTNIGIDAVEISGLGGTHWGRIEGARASKESMHAQTAFTFKDWGIRTIASTLEAVALKPKYEIWGSGGVRNGLDAAKLLALGAHSVGFAKQMLEAAMVDTEIVLARMNQIEHELKVALFCTGSQNLYHLRGKYAFK